jgi:hypothetical protein
VRRWVVVVAGAAALDVTELSRLGLRSPGRFGGCALAEGAGVAVVTVGGLVVAVALGVAGGLVLVVAVAGGLVLVVAVVGGLAVEVVGGLIAATVDVACGASDGVAATVALPEPAACGVPAALTEAPGATASESSLGSGGNGVVAATPDVLGAGAFFVPRLQASRMTLEQSAQPT